MPINITSYDESDEQVKENLLNKNFIKEISGTRIIELFKDWNNLEDKNFELKDINKVEWLLNYEEFINKFWIQKNDFNELKKENVWEKPLVEIFKTYEFLYSKFYNAKTDLEYLNIDFETFLEAIIDRLIFQVKEAWNGDRILKNWIVVWISKYNNEWFEFIKVPYYAFACTNVSLDEVKINDKNWDELSLRQIDSRLWGKSKNWDFFLPNSLWVSVCMYTKNNEWNIEFVSQERNNKKVLSENKSNFIASASWWVPISILEWKNIKSWLIKQMNNEIQEEIWLNSKIIDNIILWDLNNNDIDNWIKIIWDWIITWLKKIIKNELWNEDFSWLIPVWLVIEEKRRNPEVIFIAATDKSINYIKSKWEQAKDKDESLSIKWITLNEIIEDLERRKKWKNPKIDNHFYMSFLWFILK